MRLRLIGTGRGCAVAGDESLLRLFIPHSCYNAPMLRRMLAIAIKVPHRMWVILTSKILTEREYIGIMIILSALGLTTWDYVEGNTTLFFAVLFAFPFLVAAAGFLYPSFVNRRHAGRVLTNHCVVCGYDLCASPDRCPECGFVPTEKIKEPIRNALRLRRGMSDGLIRCTILTITR